jgi:hypothetical protein
LVDADGADGEHALEDERGAAALEALALAAGFFPDETVGGDGKLMVARRPCEIGDLEDAVLRMRGNDGKIFAIERNKLQVGHSGSTPLPLASPEWRWHHRNGDAVRQGT